jgi:DNA-binding NtrC family response regulator
VRELRNAVERALMFHTGNGPLRITPPALPADTAAGPGITLEFGLPLEEVERRYIAATLEREGSGDLAGAAERLGISRKTLWDKRRRYGI